MIIRLLIIAIAVILSSTARAETPISYTEVGLLEGNEVNLTQGFYICTIDNPRELMADLLAIKDDNSRRKLAKSRGCPFSNSFKENAPIFNIKYVASSMCEDRSIGYELIEQAGKTIQKPVINCGREAHQFTVEHHGRDIVVIFISLDVDYD